MLLTTSKQPSTSVLNISSTGCAPSRTPMQLQPTADHCLAISPFHACCCTAVLSRAAEQTAQMLPRNRRLCSQQLQYVAWIPCCCCAVLCCCTPLGCAPPSKPTSMFCRYACCSCAARMADTTTHQCCHHDSVMDSLAMLLASPSECCAAAPAAALLSMTAEQTTHTVLLRAAWLHARQSQHAAQARLLLQCCQDRRAASTHVLYATVTGRLAVPLVVPVECAATPLAAAAAMLSCHGPPGYAPGSPSMLHSCTCAAASALGR
jgi:hypothetical protein